MTENTNTITSTLLNSSNAELVEEILLEINEEDKNVGKEEIKSVTTDKGVKKRHFPIFSRQLSKVKNAIKVNISENSSVASVKTILQTENTAVDIKDDKENTKCATNENENQEIHHRQNPDTPALLTSSSGLSSISSKLVGKLFKKDSVEKFSTSESNNVIPNIDIKHSMRGLGSTDIQTINEKSDAFSELKSIGVEINDIRSKINSENNEQGIQCKSIDVTTERDLKKEKQPMDRTLSKENVETDTDGVPHRDKTLDETDNFDKNDYDEDDDEDDDTSEFDDYEEEFETYDNNDDKDLVGVVISKTIKGIKNGMRKILKKKSKVEEANNEDEET